VEDALLCFKWVVYDYNCLSYMVYCQLNMKVAESLHTEIKSLHSAKNCIILSEEIPNGPKPWHQNIYCHTK